MHCIQFKRRGLVKQIRFELIGVMCGLALCCVVPRAYGAADAAPVRKLRVAITSLSGSMAVPWLAREAGIFKKHGLEVEVIATPSGVEGMNALIAGEINFLQIAGATTVSAQR
jgi:ABC-type nitrate/sulfonate/bicarbonate transport system substrate-binding protein